ncbi:MAG TPA: choice-of-anchor D domain-containing protein, partial [Polyangiaceae bacterium]|nr:choice-of-anchor D domain-containing protein [Polyangiaceae bacterium]
MCSRLASGALAVIAPLLLAAQCGEASLTAAWNPNGTFRAAANGTAKQTLVLTNSGSVAATLGDLSSPAVGLNGTFLLTGGTCRSGGLVAPNGGSCTLEVTYAPTAAESFPFSVQIQIGYNWADSGGAERFVKTSAAGFAYDRLLLSWDEPGAWVPRPSPAQLGAVSIGLSKSATFLVENFSATDVVLGTISTAGLGLAPPFAVTGGTCASGATLRALGGACALNISFSPTEVGGRAPFFAVPYTLAGGGAGPELRAQIAGFGVEAVSLSNGPTFDFGPLSLGSTAIKLFTVSNWHEEDASLTGLSDAGLGLGAPFSLVGGTCLSGALRGKGTHCTLAVAFSSGALDTMTDTLRLDYRLAGGAALSTSIGVRGGGVVADPVQSIAAGAGHTCAVLASGKLRCWGYAQYGVLGYGNLDTIGDDEFPNVAGNVSVGGGVRQAASGNERTCVLLQSGGVRCWGYDGDGYGFLGYGSTLSQLIVGDNELPSSLGEVSMGGIATQISASAVHVCALLQGGGVRCWGSGGYYALGYPGVFSRAVPSEL